MIENRALRLCFRVSIVKKGFGSSDCSGVIKRKFNDRPARIFFDL